MNFIQATLKNDLYGLREILGEKGDKILLSAKIVVKEMDGFHPCFIYYNEKTDCNGIAHINHFAFSEVDINLLPVIGHTEKWIDLFAEWKETENQ